MSARPAEGGTHAAENGLLKISELAERSGVPVATIRHYLREGLLPEPVKTSRNMAYYPPEFVERIRVIKQLQEERFLPLRVIRDLLDRQDAEPERLRAMIALEDRILERALVGEQRPNRRRGGPQSLRRPAGGAGPPGGARRPDARPAAVTRPRTCAMVEAIGRFRAGGYDERLGFTVYDTLRYKRALEPLVADEVDVLTSRLSGDVDLDRAAGDHRGRHRPPERPDDGAAHEAPGCRLAQHSRKR